MRVRTMKITLRQPAVRCPVKQRRVAHSANPLSSRRRIVVLGIFAVSFSTALVVRLGFLQGSQHHSWRELASKQYHADVEVQGARGALMDRDGRVLAVSVPAVAIAVREAQFKEGTNISKILSPVLGVKEQELRKKMQKEKAFIWLGRGLPLATKAAVENLRLAGVEVYDEFRRFYPQGALAGPVLGRVSRDGEGQAGLEHWFNHRLAAADNHISVRRDARGRLLPATAWTDSERADSGNQPLLSQKTESFARFSLASLGDTPSGIVPQITRHEGIDISLSIDSFVQNVLDEELKRGSENAKAHKAFALVMDADSGELLAISQSPGFDPNSMENVRPEDLKTSISQDTFEPGSTFKPLIAAVAYDAGKVSPHEMMNCENGVFHIGGRIVRDVHPVGVVPFDQVIVRSSNVCMSKVGLRLGAGKLHDALTRLGFGERTGIELSGEENGIMRSVQKWQPIDVATHSFGQGISVTALQLARAYAAMANGGILVRPTLVKAEHAGSRPEAKKGRRVFSERAARTIAAMLRGVVEDEEGTGHEARIAGVTVYGKTGTAQKVLPGGRGYDPDNILASFVGFVDGNEIGIRSRLVMFIAMDEPQVRPRWGGIVAAPVFRKAMERILAHLLSVEGKALQTA